MYTFLPFLYYYFWFRLPKIFWCSQNGIILCFLSLLHVSKQFAAVFLPESMSPVLNIPQMIFPKEPMDLFSKFVKVHCTHSTVRHFHFWEEEEWKAGSNIYSNMLCKNVKNLSLRQLERVRNICHARANKLRPSECQNDTPHPISPVSLICKNFALF